MLFFQMNDAPVSLGLVLFGQRLFYSHILQNRTGKGVGEERGDGMD
jgi:hypothetical protein